MFHCLVILSDLHQIFLLNAGSALEEMKVMTLLVSSSHIHITENLKKERVVQFSS